MSGSDRRHFSSSDDLRTSWEQSDSYSTSSNEDTEDREPARHIVKKPKKEFMLFEVQKYDESRRNREAIVKRIFGAISGIGWGLGIAALLTVAPIASVGLTHVLVLSVGAGLGTTGGVFGFFQTKNKAQEANEREKNLIEKINKDLRDAQLKQIELLRYITEMEEIISKKWDAFVKEKEILNEEELRSVAIAARAIQHALEHLHPIEIGTLTVIENGKDKEVRSLDLNTQIESAKEICGATCEKILKNNLIKDFIQEKKDSKKALQPMLSPRSKDNVSINTSPVVTQEKPRSLWDRFTHKVSKLGTKIYSAGAGVGLGVTIGSIMAITFLATNPAGWVVAATICGIAAGALLLGGLSMFIDHKINHHQEKNMARLTELDTQITEYSGNQKHDVDTLKNQIKEMKLIEDKKRMGQDLMRTQQELKAYRESAQHHGTTTSCMMDAFNIRPISKAKAKAKPKRYAVPELTLNNELSEKEILQQQLAEAKKQKEAAERRAAEAEQQLKLLSAQETNNNLPRPGSK